MARSLKKGPYVDVKLLRRVEDMNESGKNASEALMILKYTPNKPARYAEKVLKSAVANAEHNHGLDMDKLIVKTATADQGAYMKRFRPVSMGRAHAFRHHTCHITMVVCEK